MKIAIVNTHMEDHLGGSQIQCDVIAEGLTERGHDVIYVAIDKIKKNYDVNYRVTGVERNADDVASKIIQIAPDILYWRFNKRFFYKTMRKIRHKDMKVVFAVSNIKDLKPYGEPIIKDFSFRSIKKYLKQKVSNRFNHFGFKYVDGLTTNNKKHLKYSPIEKKIYVPNAITDKSISFQWDKPFVFWVANIKKRKRPEIYIELAKKLKDKEVDFLMVGKISDSEYNWIKESSDTLPNFHHLGAKKVEEVNGILEKSLFLITTSTPEGFSNNIIQAWLQGKPTISYEFDPGGFIESEKLGYVSHSDKRRFLDQVEYLLKNENERNKIGRRAAKFAENYFSKNNTINLIESFFQEINK